VSSANEYPLGGDLTDDRISGLLHTTLERLARRVARQNFQLFQLYADGSNAFGMGNQVMGPTGSDWRDVGQGTDCKVMDMNFGSFSSTWRLNSPGCGGTSSVTPGKYKAPKRPGAPAPFPWPPAPGPMPNPGNPHPAPGGKSPRINPYPDYGGARRGDSPGFPASAWTRWNGITAGTPVYEQGLVDRVPSGDREGEVECSTNAVKSRRSVALAAADIPANTYIQGQITGYIPGAEYRPVRWGPNGISLDLRAKAVWDTDTEGAGKKVFMYIGAHKPNCSQPDAYVAENTTFETEGLPYNWSPWNEYGLVAGTAKSSEYNPQQITGLALGTDWRGGDLLVIDVKIYTDGDAGHTLSELELAVGELTLDVNYA